MAEEVAKVVVYEEQTSESEAMKPEEAQAVESTDRGLFDFMTKKENKEDDQMVSDFETKVQVSETGEEYHELVHKKLHPSDTSSSSSSDEEEGDEEEKKRKKKEKKGLKEKIKEKLQGHEGDEKLVEYHDHHHEETNVPIEKVYEESFEPQVQAEEKKGFMEKIKEKLPGHHKKADDDGHVAPTTTSTTTPVLAADEPKEKKGFMDKIKEKIPGYHSKNATEE